PDDTASHLDDPDRGRVSGHGDRETFRRLTGEEPRSLTRPRDHGATDVFNPHPVYGALGWVAVVNPGENTPETIVQLLREAHAAARARFERRLETGARPPEEEGSVGRRQR